MGGGDISPSSSRNLEFITYLRDVIDPCVQGGFVCVLDAQPRQPT
jgi:hypothetical protein